jgi:hypothetical protein
LKLLKSAALAPAFSRKDVFALVEPVQTAFGGDGELLPANGNSIELLIINYINALSKGQ